MKNQFEVLFPFNVALNLCANEKLFFHNGHGNMLTYNSFKNDTPLIIQWINR